MNDKILSALLQLDTNNDDHWTSDGLPRMDAVEAILGDKGITRQQVTAAKPGFSRTIAAATAAQAQGSQGSTEPAAKTAPVVAKQPSVTPTTAPAEEAVTEQVEDAGDAQGAEARAALTQAQKELQELQAKGVEIAEEIKAKSLEVDALNDALIAVVGQETTVDAIQGYLAQQRKTLTERANRIQAIRESGVNLADLTRNLKAPIDAAMVRKVGHGLGRPGAK